MPPINGAVLAIIRELVRVVPGLDMADRIILAHALADPDSWFLTTSDGMMIDNPAIIQYEAQPRGQGRRSINLTVTHPLKTFPAF